MNRMRIDRTVVKTDETDGHEVLLALSHLDQLLDGAIALAQSLYGSEAATDPYRGLYINHEQLERALTQDPGVPLLYVPCLVTTVNHLGARGSSRLAQLAQTFELSDFDLDLLLIALAPEIDLRYERIYAYLQDDVTRKLPTVDLALNLLCATASEKLHCRMHLTPDAPLLRCQILQLIGDVSQPQSPLLSAYLKLDPAIVLFLLGQTCLDPRLGSFCQMIQPPCSPDRLDLEVGIQQGLLQLCMQSQAQSQPLRVYLQGAAGTTKQQVGAAIATQLNVPLMVADLHPTRLLKTDLELTLKVLFRDAQLHQAVLYLEGMDELRAPDQMSLYQQVWKQVAIAPGITLLSGQQPWTTTGSGDATPMIISFPKLDFEQGRTCWASQLSAIGMTLDAPSLDLLASRFHLTPGQISDVVSAAHHAARWRVATQPQPQPQAQVLPTLDDLCVAARAQSGHDLVMLARKIQPRYTWDDIVLPADPYTQLRQLCQQVRYQHVVYQQWGFEQKLSLGKGLNALFSGPPGTGKTMAAEVVAHALGLDLYKIDLSQIVSKYIGETEKNLNRIFTTAESTNAILFFDEADALFGKRSDVKDAHDRYANLEIAYLLQKMEEYEGISILTTNLVQNLDDAFTRRLRFIVEFPFPEAEYRLQIWQQAFPQQTPIAADVDFGAIARLFKLSGGNIRNVALAAAFLAAETGQAVHMTHLLQATRQEFQKMGRLISEDEFLQFKTTTNKM